MNANDTVAQQVAPRDLYLAANDINTGHLLGNRVLHLDTWIDLDKIDVFLFIDQELYRTGIAVTHMPGDGQCIVE